jgi:hypothetical protein
VKNAGSGPGTIKTPNRFWAEYGNGISVGVQAGSPILMPCQMKSKRNCWSNIVSVNAVVSKLIKTYKKRKPNLSFQLDGQGRVAQPITTNTVFPVSVALAKEFYPARP